MTRDFGTRPTPPDQVAADQRNRILKAITDLVAERGYQQTTIDLITRDAGVSLGTFYEHFADKEECFLAAFDAGVESAANALDELLDRDQPWAELVAEGLAILLELAAAEPAHAKLCLVASQSAGSAAFARYQKTLERISPVLREGRSFNPAASQLPDGLEAAIAGGLGWLIHQRLVNDGGEDLRGLLPEMVQLTLTPFVGEEEARRTAHAAGSQGRRPASRVLANRVGAM